MGRMSAICFDFVSSLRGPLLIISCAISVCTEKQEITNNNSEKPIFVGETLSYIPFANSYADQPPTSLGLVNANDASQSIKIVDNSSVSGNIDFLYQTEFNYFGDDNNSPFKFFKN